MYLQCVISSALAMEIPQSCTEPQKCFPGLYEFQSQLPIQDLYYMSGNRCATQDKFGHHIGVVTYDLVPNRQNYQVSTNLLQNAAWHCQCFGLPHWPQRKGTAILHIIFKYIFNINLGIISTFFPQIDSLVQDYAILVSCASAMEISQFCTLSLEYPLGLNELNFSTGSLLQQFGLTWDKLWSSHQCGYIWTDAKLTRLSGQS